MTDTCPRCNQTNFRDSCGRCGYSTAASTATSTAAVTTEAARAARMPPPKRKPAKPAGSFLVKIGFALSALTLVIAIFGVLSIGVAAVACGLGYSAAKQGNPTGRMVILSAILALAVGLLIGVATM